MAQRATGLVKRPADGSTKQDNPARVMTDAVGEASSMSRDSGVGSVATETTNSQPESDDGKFASLTAGLLLRKGDATQPDNSAQKSSGQSANLFARKGEARPSMSSPPSSSHPQWEAIELQHLRDKLTALETTLGDREAALARADQDAEDARKQQQQESHNVLLRAEQNWTAEANARFAAAEAQWQKKYAKAAGESQIKSAHIDAKEIELRHLREKFLTLESLLTDRESALAASDAQVEATRALAAQTERTLCQKLSAAQSALADREKALAQASFDVDKARANWRQENQNSLLEARKNWQKEADARLAKTEAHWQQKLTRALADISHSQGDRTELRHLQEKLAALEAALADREAALTRFERGAEEERKQQQKEAQEALKRAEQKWMTEANARFATAESQWQQKCARVAAEAGAKKERVDASETELKILHEKLLASQTLLAEREGELARVTLDNDHMRASWQQEAQEALLETERVWKADMAARLAATEAHWQQKLTHATADAARVQGDQNELRNLREKLTVLRATLAERDVELANARSALQPTHDLRDSTDRIVLRPNRMWRNAEMRERETRRPFRDVIVAASLAAAAILFYPSLEPFIPGNWRANISAIPAIGPMLSETRVPEKSPPPVPPKPPEQHWAVVVQGVNLRAGASTATEIISTLQRGSVVATIGQQGNWTRVQIENGRQGWVFSSYLKSSDAALER